MRLFLAILLLSYKTIGFAQTNLIENGSFEELIACPTWSGAPSSIELANGWRNPVWYYSNPDLFHSCANEIAGSPAGVPINWTGFQDAFEGEAYVGLGIYFNTPELRNPRVILPNFQTNGLVCFNPNTL